MKGAFCVRSTDAFARTLRTCADCASFPAEGKGESRAKLPTHLRSLAFRRTLCSLDVFLSPVALNYPARCRDRPRSCLLAPELPRLGQPSAGAPPAPAPRSLPHKAAASTFSRHLLGSSSTSLSAAVSVSGA